ncbi:hypothetical protein ACJIZ3_004047 [Penstemon smallii]|uniref:Uncharacterized protein n=1 Tax=Penstemon smallii TaxID=265156 RepID=A0ABD3S0Z8_9LAMI
MSTLSVFCILISYSALAEEMTLENAPKSNLETYIVHVKLPKGRLLSELDDIKSWYNSFLPIGELGSSRLVHSYRHVVTGFAAKLSPEEAKGMEKKDGFITARPHKKLPLHTTHSPNFLGLHQNLGAWPGSNYGEGVIIGVLDTGITPGHPSFSDEGMPPPPKKWKGKCEFNGTSGGGIARIAKGQTVLDAGGLAMILMNDEPNGYSTIADPHVIAATHVSYDAGQKIRSYINSTSTPTATIDFKGTVIGDPMAPMITSFSSRGPSLASPGILKPDIIGPGVSILAAWPVSVDNNTNSNATFNMISGTSMSCPHLSGIAALLKSAHPDWSPAAIKSAIMTSATQFSLNGGAIVDETYSPANVFALGAGHVNPPNAINPGLIYDLQPDDYIPYLCGLGYTDQEIEVIVQHTVTCSNGTSIPEAQLNYPSFALQLGAVAKTYTRTVTNVGEANSTYAIEIDSILGVDVAVSPSILSFSEVKQKMTYEISFSQSTTAAYLGFVEGAIVWRSSNHVVRSPISVNLV